jgi:hypothetical protein
MISLQTRRPNLRKKNSLVKTFFFLKKKKSFFFFQKQEKMTDTQVDLWFKANRYVAEFRWLCNTNGLHILSFMAQCVSLESQIASMTLAEMVPYTDYVTQRLCQEDDAVFLEFAQGAFRELGGILQYAHLGVPVSFACIFHEMQRRRFSYEKAMEARVLALIQNGFRRKLLLT